MDLSSLSISESSKLILKHPVTGDELDGSILLCGKDSDTYRKQYGEMIKKISSDQAKGSDSDFVKLDIDVYVACTIGWENISIGDDQLEFTPDNVRMVYTDQRFKWLHDQVVEFVGKRENFMQRA